MRRKFKGYLALFLAALSALTGCMPTQPLYLREDGDLSHYLEQATQQEIPDLDFQSLEEVDQAKSPLTLANPEFRDIWDLSLEQCVAIALHNSKVIRGSGPPSLQTLGGNLSSNVTTTEQVSAGADSIQVANFAQFQATSSTSTTFDVAVTESAPGFFTTPNQLRNSIGNLPSINQLSTQGVEAALAEFDAQLTSSINWSRTDRPVNVIPAFAGFPSVSIANTSDFDTTLSKKTATGAHFFARHTVGYNRGNQFGALRAVPSAWTAALEVETRIPFLQGAGVQVNRVPVVIARIQADKSIAALYTSLQNALCNLEIRYWDLYLAYRDLETAKESRDSSLQIWKLVKSRLDGGISDTQEEAQARAQYYANRAQVESALSNLFAQEMNLRWLMGLASSDGRLIRPSDEPTLARVDFDGRAVIEEAIQRQPKLVQVRWDVKQREVEMILARNRLLPQLNAVGLYRFVGLGDELISANRNGLAFPAVGSTAWENLTGGRFQEFVAGFDFAMPVGFRRELAGVRNAQLNLARNRAVLEDLELDVAREASHAVRAASTNYRVAQSQFNSWRASVKEVEVFLAREEGGVERLDLVLDAQQRRANARRNYFAAVVEYNQAIALVHLRKGSIADYSGVAFAEGPWPDKAYWDSLGHARRRDAGTYLNYGWTRPRVISQGPVGHGYGVYPSQGETYEQYGEEIPTPQPTPAPQENGAPMNEPTPASDFTGGDSLRLAPPGSVLWQTAAEQPGAIGSGVPAVHGDSTSRPEGVSEPVRPVSFQWEGVSVPARGAAAKSANSSAASSAEPARLPQHPVSSMQPLSAGGGAWQAKR